jgi:hypothetical protein
LTGIAPAAAEDWLRTSSGAEPSQPASPDGHFDTSKFEAAARLLEEARLRQPHFVVVDAAPPLIEEAHEVEVPPVDTMRPSVTEAAPESTDDPLDGVPSRTEHAESAPDAPPTSIAPASRRGGGKLLFLLAAMTLSATALIATRRAGHLEAVETARPVPTPASPANGSTERPVVVAQPPPPAAPAALATPEPPAEVAAPAPSANTENAVEPNTTASAAAQAPGAFTRVTVTGNPTGAKFYRKGRLVGTNTIVVELAAGEKQAFELGLPGHVTRKVVVDGSTPEMVIGLLPARHSGAKPPSSTSVAEPPAAP